MDMVLSAMIGDLVSRLFSFMIEKSQTHVSSNNHTQSRLQLLLLRAETVVVEADCRRITNHGMILQLKLLREAMYRGYYLLDGSDTWQNSQPKRAIISRQRKVLQREMDNLESMLDGMKEFLLILMHCPPTIRQPYNTHMFVERCMFGRHTEKEQIISFLLHPSSSFEVLPVTGSFFVGKATLVEHVCMDEEVRRNFTTILHLSGEDLSNISNDNTDSDDYRRKLGLSDNGRYLMIAELVDDTDVVAWSKLYHCLRHGANNGSKVILISRMDHVSSLGTAQAVQLSRFRQEEYWYFFRVLAFGSANPYDHPDLMVLGQEIAKEFDGSIPMAYMVTKVLRANMNKQFWRRVLWCVRKSIHTHILVSGEDPRHRQSRTRYLSYLHCLSHGGPLIFLRYEGYKIRSMAQGDIERIKTSEEVILGATDMKYGETFDVIVSQARIPPYTTHIMKGCVVEKPKGIYLEDRKCLNKRKRTQR